MTMQRLGQRCVAALVLTTRNVADHRACHSECQRMPGCTGYSFDRAPKIGRAP